MKASMTGQIAIGPFTIAVKAYATVRETRESFRIVHRPCATPLNRRYVCTACGVEASPETQVSALERGSGPEKKWLYFEPEDLDALAPSTEEGIVLTVQASIPIATLNPTWRDRIYSLLPNDQAAMRPYAILRRALSDEKVGLFVRFPFYRRDRIGIIAPWDQGLMLFTLYYPMQFQMPEVETPPVAIPPNELLMAKALLKEYSKRWRYDELEDPHDKKLAEIVEDKLAQKPPRREIGVPPTLPAKVISLAERLKASIKAVRAEKKRIKRKERAT